MFHESPIGRKSNSWTDDPFTLRPDQQHAFKKAGRPIQAAHALLGGNFRNVARPLARPRFVPFCDSRALTNPTAKLVRLE